MELLLVVCRHAMMSEHPIIDPLSSLNPDTLTESEKKRARGQVAYGFMSTCWGFYQAAYRDLWRQNKFVFTSPQALHRFARIAQGDRALVKSVTLRIIAKYYDDDADISHMVHSNALGRAIKLKIIPRPRGRESKLVRGGFKSYAWLQVIDFLDALRPPYHPDDDKIEPVSHTRMWRRPRLFPSLEFMRMDFVNFPTNLLRFFDHAENDLRTFSEYDLGRSINELMLTGLPRDDLSMSAMISLLGMVKDDGLLHKSEDAFVLADDQLHPTADRELSSSLIRGWKSVAYAAMAPILHSVAASDTHRFQHLYHLLGMRTDPAPPEHVEPRLTIWKNRRTIWKRVPTSRDSEERRWVEFSRITCRPTALEPYNPEDDYDDFVDLLDPNTNLPVAGPAFAFAEYDEDDEMEMG